MCEACKSVFSKPLTVSRDEWSDRKFCSNDCRKVRALDGHYGPDMRARKYRLKREFNMTLEDYNLLFVKQYGKCGICKRHQSELKRALCVDHDHDTKQIRGLLCTECNRGIGLLGDTHERLMAAQKYLQAVTNS